MRIQYLGHAHGAHGLQIDGDPAARDFTATFTQDDRPTAALIVGCLTASGAAPLGMATQQSPESESGITLTPHHELACVAATAQCDRAVHLEDIAVVTGGGSEPRKAARARPAGAPLLCHDAHPA